MANIHGISDSRNQNQNRGRNNLRQPFDIEGNNRNDNIPFLNSGNSGIGQPDPRKETVVDMFRQTCCPIPSIYSFALLMTIIQIAVFILSLIWRGIVRPSPNFLTPNPQTLHEFGNRDPNLMRNQFQIWRFVTPVLLHAHFLHLFFNCVSQLFIGSQIELALKTKKTALLYFLSAIGGNLFGALRSEAQAVGASTAICGLVGCFIGYIIMNWYRIDSARRCFLIVIASFIVVINILFGMSEQSSPNNQVDSSGHLGGLLVGIFLGMAIINPNGGVFDEHESTVKKIGVGLSIIFFAGCILFFYVFNS